MNAPLKADLRGYLVNVQLSSECEGMTHKGAPVLHLEVTLDGKVLDATIGTGFKVHCIPVAVALMLLGLPALQVDGDKQLAELAEDACLSADEYDRQEDELAEMAQVSW